jgi:succinate dehydrogenase/fumarate reductase cytochrome b subunit
LLTSDLKSGLFVFKVVFLLVHFLFVLKAQTSYADADDKYRYEIKDILEMEMKILEALKYYLVVFHPYRSLSG